MHVLRAVWIAAAMGAVVLTACRTPQARVYPSLVATPELAATSPADIAVMPVVDATPDHVAGHILEPLRDEVARALVSRLYTPLANDKVDAALRKKAAASAADASAPSSTGAGFGEDATLSIRITRWDQSALMARAWASFTVDVALVSSTTGATLWSGSVRGDVKAGGEGPAPLDRASRERSAAAEVARALIGRLPKRRP